jgi:uncharacterized protein YqjF (DUF2071 family)
MSDFNHAILDETAHRPWPMPSGPWVMTQTWNDLLFAHWPVDASQLIAKLPPGISLDLHQGRAWVGLVPFYMTNVALRGMPAVPGVSAFAELNVRTYVRVGDKPGVYFFSLDAASRLAVRVARRFYHLPYFYASMSVYEVGGSVDYTSRRHDRHGRPADFVARYEPAGETFPPAPGSLEYFLTERYCLYTTDHEGRVRVAEIHHPPWPLQMADAEFQLNTMALAAGIHLPPITPLLHFAKRQDMVAWGLGHIEPRQVRS